MCDPFDKTDLYEINIKQSKHLKVNNVLKSESHK